MDRERFRQRLALAILIVVGLAWLVAEIDPSRPIPGFAGPLAAMAAGYLLGVQIMGGGKD